MTSRSSLPCMGEQKVCPEKRKCRILTLAFLWHLTGQVGSSHKRFQTFTKDENSVKIWETRSHLVLSNLDMSFKSWEKPGPRTAFLLARGFRNRSEINTLCLRFLICEMGKEITAAVNASLNGCLGVKAANPLFVPAELSVARSARTESIEATKRHAL